MRQRLFTCFCLSLAFLLVGCSLPAGTSTIGMQAVEIPTNTVETTVRATSTPAEPTRTLMPSNLIAYYPLTGNLDDLTGRNAPATASYGTPTLEGFYCAAVCDLTTPDLIGFNLHSFTIRMEFLATKRPAFRDPVFVAGAYRWAMFHLQPDGHVALVYNNDQVVDCSVQYQLNVWHEADITYDGTTLNLYLDGTPGCSVVAGLDMGDESTNITLVDGSYGVSFSGVVKDLKVFSSVEIPQASVPLPAALTITDPTMGPVDGLLASCPSEAVLAAIDADLRLSFEADPSAGNLVCTRAEGSRDLTSFKRIVYTTLLVMKQIEFNQHLPWTDKQLYAWFVDTVKGIRFRSDIQYSSCCEPAGMINIQTGNLIVNETNRWIDPQIGVGAMDLMILFVHEARHNEFGGHTCGTNDNTRAEMGSWGVQYYLETYLAENLKDPSYYSSPLPSLAHYNAEIAMGDAESILSSRFCNDH